MSDRNHDRLPGTEKLSPFVEEVLLEAGVDKVTENAKQWALKAFDLGDLFKPDDDTWAGIGVPSAVTDTPPPPPSRKKATAPKWFPELISYDNEEPLDRPKIVPPSSMVSATEPEKVWVSPDPFEQKTPASVLEQDHKFYIEKFRTFFEGLESDTIERSIERYAKILLYLLLEFGIDMSTENSNFDEELKEAKKDQIMTDLFFECKNDPEIAEKYNAELQRKKRLKENYKKHYVYLSPDEKNEMKLRYVFYVGRYELVRWIREETEKKMRLEKAAEEAEKQRIQAEIEKEKRIEREIATRRQRDAEINLREEERRRKEEAERIRREQLQTKIKVIEEEAKYALDKQQAQMIVKDRIDDIAKNEVEWIIKTMKEKLLQEATQNTGFNPAQIRSIWTTVVDHQLGRKTQNLVQKIIKEALPQNPEKPEIIEITRKLAEKYELSKGVRGIFEAAISGRLQHEQKHAERLKTEDDVTLLGYT